MWGSGTRILRFNQKDYQETNQQLKGVVASTVPPEYTSSEPSSHKLAEQVHRDYTPSDMAASQRVTNGFGPLYCLAASLRNCFTAVPSITKKTGWRRPGFPKGIHAKALHQSQPAGQAPENDDSVKDARPTHRPLAVEDGGGRNHPSLPWKESQRTGCPPAHPPPPSPTRQRRPQEPQWDQVPQGNAQATRRFIPGRQHTTRQV